MDEPVLCEHGNVLVTVDWTREDPSCGCTTCHDCGSTPTWWYVVDHSDECHRCWTKGGNRDYVKVDVDKFLTQIRERLPTLSLEQAREVAKSILDASRSDW